ncbi:hypothetical protein ACRARH_07710 [Phytobacter ursingii]
MKPILYWRVKVLTAPSITALPVIAGKAVGQQVLIEGFSKKKPKLPKSGVLELLSEPKGHETHQFRIDDAASMICTPVYESEES